MTEKERRWWAEHGRDFREYRRGDLFINSYERNCYVKEIIAIKKEKSHPIRFKEVSRGGAEDGYSPKASLTIVCFAENRLDI